MLVTQSTNDKNRALNALARLCSQTQMDEREKKGLQSMCLMFCAHRLEVNFCHAPESKMHCYHVHNIDHIAKILLLK